MGIKKILDGITGIRVISTARSVDELFSALAKGGCDVLICDFTFDDNISKDGIPLIERLLCCYPSVKIILLTVREELVLVRRVLAMGVKGFIGKSSSTLEGLPVGIRAVFSGGVYLDPAISRMLSQRFLASEKKVGGGRFLALSKREFEVVSQFAKGKSVSDIARETGRSVKTVSTQKARAMEKLEVSNDVELVDRIRALGASIYD
jgi:two-component system capsular synthesis response regulator RcsB